MLMALGFSHCRSTQVMLLVMPYRYDSLVRHDEADTRDVASLHIWLKVWYMVFYSLLHGIGACFWFSFRRPTKYGRLFQESFHPLFRHTTIAVDAVR